MSTVNRMSNITRYTGVFDEDGDKPDDSSAQAFAELLARPCKPARDTLHDLRDESHALSAELIALLKAMLEENFFRSLSGKPAKYLKLRLTNGRFAGLLIEAEQKEETPGITIRLFIDEHDKPRFLRAFGHKDDLAASLSDMFNHPITVEVYGK